MPTNSGQSDGPERALQHGPIRPPVVTLDRLALLAVFLQITELYRPLGLIAAVPTSLYVNVMFLAFFALYLVARHQLLMQLHSLVPLGWAFAFILAPAVVMSLQVVNEDLSPERLTYWCTYSLLFTLLFFTSVVLWIRFGPGLTMPFFLGCLAATWFGFVVNWTNYEFLREVMAFTSNPISASLKTTRMIGFYQHPNAAAFSLVLFFAALACDRRFLTSNLSLQVVAAAAWLVGVLVTGSRTSLLLSLLVFAWYTANLMKVRQIDSISTRVRALITPLAPILTISGSLLALLYIASSRADLGIMLTDRFKSIVNLFDDASANVRLSVLSDYLGDVVDSPLLGYGPDFASDQTRSGNYLNVSQNSWLEWAIAFGVPYSIVMAAMLWSTYRLAIKTVRNVPLSMSYARLSLILLSLITLSMVHPFWMRSPVCALGVLVGLLLQGPRLSSSGPQGATGRDRPSAKSTNRNGRKAMRRPQRQA
jgi:hypothetical protein